MISILFVFLLKERVAIEANHLICHTSTSKLIANGLGD
jgi:hypothetical protein